MKLTLSPNKKLIQYTASAAAFLALNEAGATVIYTDLDPDVTIGGEGAEISFDINSDGEDDLTLSANSFAGVGTFYGVSFTYSAKAALVEALGNNELLGTITTYMGYSGVYAPVLEAGEGINSEDNFENGSASLGLSVHISVYGIPYNSYVIGNWLATDMKFLGFEINIDTNSYYGCMRISVSENATSITVHDYAYEDEANKAIFTGQVATGVTETHSASIDVYSNTSNIYINLSQKFEESADIFVFDLSGRLVKQKTGLTGSQIISCSELPGGNYIVKVSLGDLTYEKQINLEN